MQLAARSSNSGETVTPRCDRAARARAPASPCAGRSGPRRAGTRRSSATAARRARCDSRRAAGASARPSIRRPAGLRIRISPSQPDDEQAGREAGDDLAAQALGRVGARRRRALLRLQLGHRFLQRREADVASRRRAARPRAPQQVTIATAARQPAAKQRAAARRKRRAHARRIRSRPGGRAMRASARSTAVGQFTECGTSRPESPEEQPSARYTQCER